MKYLCALFYNKKLKIMKKQLLSAFIALFCMVSAFAQEGLWVKTDKGRTDGLELMDRASMPVAYDIYSLNLPMLKSLLQQAPSRETATTSQVIIEFPDGNGGLDRFRIFEASIMHPDLAAQHPEIGSYAGQSVKNPASTIRFTVTPFGVHTMLFSDNGTTYTDTYTKDKQYYISYKKSDVQRVRSFGCSFVGDTDAASRNMFDDFPVTTDSNDSTFRRYRLAMACSIEYAAFHINAAGAGGASLDDRKNVVLAAMNVTVTRVNAIYERDLAVTLQIIPTNKNVIFVESDALSNTDAMINQIQSIMNSGVGASNYDIGHVVGTGDGGVAIKGSICTTNKARGVTGNPSPIGDPFDVDYVAHEMGHQLGAEHTFNGNTGSCGGGNRNAGTAVEPGSGSTIMAYAGICSPLDVQNNSDAYFNTVSLDEIFSVISGLSCGVQISNGNTPPAIANLTNYTIPRGTAFVLKGSATDANGDALTYCWEQTNANGSTGTQGNSPQPGATTGPLFRSLPPKTSPERYFPSLESVLQGNLTPTWEVTPNAARVLNFALTVRDNRMPNGGQTSRKDMSVTVNAVSGPFAVTSQNLANTSWAQGSTQTVTWNVANTAAAPVSTANVNILLSTDGGLTFPTVLKANTANDGTESVTVPNVSGTNCRIKVEAVNNIYYAVNSTPFQVGIVTVCNSFPSNTVVQLPDGAGTSSPTFSEIMYLDKVVTGTGTVSDVNVTVNVTHPSVRDILVALRHPDQTTIVFLWENKACAQGNFNINFDDASASAIVCGNPTSGTFQPVGSLTAFNNKSVAGTWTLMIADGYAGNTGQINSWNLEICTQQAASTEQFASMSDFAIYPNPNNGNFTVSFTSGTAQDIKIGVYDMRGRQVMQRSYANTGAFSGNINLDNVEAGIYLVNVEDGANRITKKIVVQ